jgi:hypothetical protein
MHTLCEAVLELISLRREGAMRALRLSDNAEAAPKERVESMQDFKNPHNIGLI